jgi:hypothetical protein
LHLFSLLDQGVTVLTSSRRLAHALRLGYAAHMQARGLGVWRTPHVLPWSTWLRQQWIEQRANASNGKPLQLLSRAQARVLWDDVVNASEIARELLSPGSAARVAARSWQRLHDYLIDPRELEAAESPEAQALYEWSARYEQRCLELDAIDEARLMDWAFAAELMPESSVALAGFDVLTPATERLIASWRKHDKLVEAAVGVTEPDVTVIHAFDADAELEQSARWDFRRHFRARVACNRCDPNRDPRDRRCARGACVLSDRGCRIAVFGACLRRWWGYARRPIAEIAIYQWRRKRAGLTGACRCSIAQGTAGCVGHIRIGALGGNDRLFPIAAAST